MKFRFFLFLLFFINHSAFADDSFTPYRAYIDNIEDDDTPITVFSIAGENWKSCEKAIDPKTKKEFCKNAIGWPNRDALITVLSDPITTPTQDAISGKMTEEQYTRIQFTYDRLDADGVMLHQMGTGYIESTYLFKQKNKSFYTAQNTKKDEVCAKPNRSDPQSKIKKDASSLKDIATSTDNLSVEKKADSLADIVGFCPLKPPNKAPRFSGNPKKQNDYDKYILPKLLKAKVPDLKKEDGSPMTREDLIKVDTLARTMYGEMALCYRRGLQYPMAVAKVILNRAENTDRAKEFIKPPHSSKAPALTQVCTTPSQFSMWRREINDEPNDTIHHGLCPPTKLNEPFWGAKQAGNYEHDIWKNTLRIATQAILEPTEFKKRTAEVNGYFYTSGVGSFHGMKKYLPSVAGRPVDREACLELWKE